MNLKRRNSPFDLLADKKETVGFASRFGGFSSVEAMQRRDVCVISVRCCISCPLYQLRAGSGVRGDAGFGSDWLSAGGAVCYRPGYTHRPASSTPTDRRGCKSDLCVGSLNFTMVSEEIREEKHVSRRVGFIFTLSNNTTIKLSIF